VTRDTEKSLRKSQVFDPVFDQANFPSIIAVFYSPQLCAAVWWGMLFLCFSVFLAVPLNLLILTVVPFMETQ
jgi:hypothetical protein